MAEQQGFTPRKKIALDNNKLNLSAPSSGGGGKTASLIWGLHKNNPRITVWTRDPADETEKNGKGKIQAELDLPILYSLLECLRSCITAAPGFKEKLENKNFTFFGGKRSDAPMVLTEIWCGKDNEGFVFISVTAPNRPVIKFRIQPNEMFHNWFSANGEKIDAARIASTYVTGYLKIVENLYSNLAISEYVDRAAEMANKQGGFGGGQRSGGFGGGGGGFNRGGGFGGQGSPAKELVEDLPF